jgi:7-cyano-7-deazaguanine reductase
MVKAFGKIRKFEPPSAIDPGCLETFAYQPAEIGLKSRLPGQWVTYTTAEFSAVCPFSGLPDMGQIIVEYVPDTRVLELKSFKYYLLSYRDVGIYQEHATQRIYADLFKLLKPKRLIVTTIYNTRGGIDTTCRIDSNSK